ncbi:conserved Plasmodium protein, unknown function [Plasmodium sp. gorilla clade G2]|uniref:conserved Plasmodium protein, unknown function n=1 Tax=Plasmodium sp. gorilla clade G2 TaxID=880535 RepID=UPI000D211162|nr:conserved Plasmodium protein, unknown function [Plasmodium sp. gorilla clade G2]SOV18306.1 conserved Plasmodium protein, unknown function [Plasmodium sp. gorilla clade G2]
MNFCLKNYFSSIKHYRKKLYQFCDEKEYIYKLTHEYIYKHIELIKYNKDILNEKENESYIYIKNNINVNKYVGKIINHLKVNKGNSGLIYFLPTIVDIYFFNYFQLNYKYKLLFLYNILNINKVKCFVSTNESSIEERKKKFLNNFCKILLYNDIYSYINQVHIIYIKKYVQEEKQKGNTKEQQKDKSYNFLYQNEDKYRDYQNNNIIPFYKKNILVHLLSHIHNAKDLCIFLFIVRNINAIHSFSYGKLLDKVLKNIYLFIINGNILSDTHINNYNYHHIDTHKIASYNHQNNNTHDYYYVDNNLVYHINSLKMRDIIYIFYQLLYLKNRDKYIFIFIKILNIINKIFFYINKTIDNIIYTKYVLDILHMLYLSNTDIEQLLFLVNQNIYIQQFFIPLILTHFYFKAFSEHNNFITLIYFNKLFKKNYLYKNNILLPIDIVPLQSIISFFKNFKKVETQNYFNTFYQMLCIKFLLKRGAEKKIQKKKHDYDDNQNIKYLYNYIDGFYHPLNINYYIFYKYIINKLINHSFNLYVSKVEGKNKCLKESINYLFGKYQDNYIYEFTKSKYFYYIYLKEVIKRTTKKKKINKIK